MRTFKYVLKRLLLGFLTFFVIMTIDFCLIKLLQPETPMMGQQAELEMARREALGYYKPIHEQYMIFLTNIFTKNEWGYSWKIEYLKPVQDVIVRRLPPTVILNLYSMVLSLPIGIFLGVIAAIYKNKWIDHLISTVVMLFISVPSFVYAFLLQYILAFKLGWFEPIIYSLADAGGSWWTWKMFYSMILPIFALAFAWTASENARVYFEKKGANTA